MPSKWPSDIPSYLPSFSPTKMPYIHPSPGPRHSPTKTPSTLPFSIPSRTPSESPLMMPTTIPSATPSAIPGVPVVPPFAPGVPSQSREHHATKEVAGVLSREHRQGGRLQAVGPRHALRSHPVAVETAIARSTANTPAVTAAVASVLTPTIPLPSKLPSSMPKPPSSHCFDNSNFRSTEGFDCVKFEFFALFEPCSEMDKIGIGKGDIMTIIANCPRSCGYCGAG